MEDCCAVCAEPLEWVGYGKCGHQEVCYTCIARLRFVLNDKRCCICKQECASVYATKALGEYTRAFTDWESLPSKVIKSSIKDGGLWYDEAVEAYFDDEKPYKTIKAMCRLYCSVCDNASEETSLKGMVRKGHVFKNIEALRRHHSSVHRLQMCGLCLEGRKGDSEVDGSEEERGGFAGHPECAFCKRRFYGDNELYQHMSQEHYTCHFCQRARPGHYEYYRNYDDLEAHFRQEHVLCEHSDCLAKKFIVFPSEAELKRHNATVHGGHMSRSQRNAALQIPVSFHYRRPGEDSTDDSGGFRRGGRNHSRHGTNRNEAIDPAVRASVETAQIEEAFRESVTSVSAERSGVNTNIQQRGAEGVPVSETEGVVGNQSDGDGGLEPSRYLAAVWSAGPSALGDAAFPPLPGTSKAERRAKAKQSQASMAARLSGNNSGTGRVRVLNTSEHRPLTNGSQVSAVVEADRGRSGQSSNRRDTVSYLRQSISLNTVAGPGPPPPAVVSSTATSGDVSNSGNGIADWGVARGNAAGTSANASNSHAVMNVVQSRGSSMNNTVTAQMSDLNLDLRAANKALVEKIRVGLKGNEQQYADFKDVSARFMKGEMSSKDYYVQITRLGLSSIVPELARLCPDPQKGKEMMEAYSRGVTSNVVDPRSLPPGLSGAFPSLPSPVVKPAPVWPGTVDSAASISSSNGILRQSRDEVVVEQLSSDGYRKSKGKSKLEGGSSSSAPPPGTEGTLINELAAARDRKPQVLVKALSPTVQDSVQPSNNHTSSLNSAPEISSSWACMLCTLVNDRNASHCAACDTPQTLQLGKVASEATPSSDKKKKKTSKFQRIRLGDGSAALLSASLNAWNQPSEPETEVRSTGSRSGIGVWNNGGGQKLVSLAQREAIVEEAWCRREK